MTSFRHTLPDGARLAVRRIGAGPPVVLLHAGPTTQRMWDRVGAELSADHVVVTYDLRGFGQSDPISTTFRHADDLLHLCDALHLERPVLAGNSLGGRVALDAAVLRPAAFERLTLFAPGLGHLPARDPFTLDIEQRIAAAVSQGDARSIVELVRRNWVSGPRRPDSAPGEAIHREVAAMLLENLTTGARNIATEAPVPGLIDRLADLAVPITVVVGDCDTSDIEAWAATITSRAPQSRLIGRSGVGHLIPLEDHAASVAAIRDIWRHD